MYFEAIRDSLDKTHHFEPHENQDSNKICQANYIFFFLLLPFNKQGSIKSLNA